MESKEFIKRVQGETGLAAPDEAEAAVAAVLGTLGEMLPPTQRRHLAAQLPKSLKDYVQPVGRASFQGSHSSASVFPGGVLPAGGGPLRCPLPGGGPAHPGGDEGPARRHPPAELADVFRELPQEYDELLTGVPATPASPSIVE